MWLSWLEHDPISWKVSGSTPGQGTCLGVWFGLLSGRARQVPNWCFSLMSMFLSHQCFPPSLSPSLPLFLKSTSIPWLVWLSGLSASLQTERSPIDSQSGHMPGLLTGQVVSCKRQLTDIPLPLFLPPFFSL